jgi:uncharacterized damage-inducible protein DinB
MSLERRFPTALGDERAVTLGWLDWQRATVHRKCAGIDEDAARRRAVPTSELTVASVVSHLRWVEWHWFERSFVGRPGHEGDPAGGWASDLTPLDELLEAYAEQCERSRTTVEQHDLDDVEAYAPEGIDLVSLRWIVGHVTEETARHLGHLDLLREALDGTRGY